MLSYSDFSMELALGTDDPYLDGKVILMNRSSLNHYDKQYRIAKKEM